jgi:hypothetical protein
MIIRLINDEDIWIPTPKLFLNIFNQTGLEVASKRDEDIINKILNLQNQKKHDPWDFNIKLRFNVLNSLNQAIPCSVNIIKNRKNDGCVSCMVISTESDKIIIKDFDYKFTSDDL